MFFLIKMIFPDLWANDAEKKDRKLVKSRAKTPRLIYTRQIYDQDLWAEIKQIERDRLRHNFQALTKNFRQFFYSSS